MRKRRSNALPCLVLALSLACLALAALAGIVVVILPAQAESAFGPASPNLSAFDRSYLSAQLLLKESALRTPTDPAGTEQTFTVPLGASTWEITNALQNSGLIRDAAAFRTYLIYSGQDTTVQAGEYTLSPAMTPLEIAQELQDATPTHVQFSILPGWRVEEIAAALPTSGLTFSPEAFLVAAAEPPQTYGFLPEAARAASLEGFLFPDTYQFAREATLEDFLAIILATFDTRLESDIQEGFARQGLDLYGAVTLASLVEREAIVDDEMPLIASVFHNRIAAGMKLDSDPTVQYAVGYNAAQNSWWTNPLTVENLQFDSPYNTYLYPGLPPGPIANPSLNALRAVAFPAQSPYYYFRAACDGTGRHLFAETLEQHIANECR